MFIITHFIAGLLIGKLTGNYTFALVGAVLIDVDHLFSYVKHRVLCPSASTKPQPLGCGALRASKKQVLIKPSL